MVGWGWPPCCSSRGLPPLSARGVEQQELAETITIRCSKRGRKWKNDARAVEKQLAPRPVTINPDEGLMNPTRGSRPDFGGPLSEMVHVLNEDRKVAMEDAASAPALDDRSGGRGGGNPTPGRPGLSTTMDAASCTQHAVGLTRRAAAVGSLIASRAGFALSVPAAWMSRLRPGEGRAA